MGTDVHIVVVGSDADLLRVGKERIRVLEQRWSRFLGTSEVTLLNEHPGAPVVVSPDTFELVSKAIAAWRATGGRYDPTVGPALAGRGYDRDFAEVARRVSPAAVSTAAAPGPAGIEMIDGINAITVPDGVTIDPGGIGKGLAADITAELLLDRGAEGALVNVGGDLRALGRAPGSDGWVVTVDDPTDAGRELLRLAMPEGAVATSSRLRRRWRTTAGEAHHIIDPATGRPADTDVVAVTVVAGEAWSAEALTKSLFLAGPAGLREIGAIDAVVVAFDGVRHATSGLEATLR
jgi:thiamine biosynthesis lipoprotein